MASSIDLETRALDQLAAQLVELGHAVTDLDDAHRDAVAMLQRGVNPPRRSGQLAASVRADVGPNGWVLAYPIRYATFVHWGAPRRHVRAQPWLLQARDRQAPELEQLYAETITEHARRVL